MSQLTGNAWPNGSANDNYEDAEAQKAAERTSEDCADALWETWNEMDGPLDPPPESK